MQISMQYAVSNSVLYAVHTGTAHSSKFLRNSSLATAKPADLDFNNKYARQSRINKLWVKISP